MTIQTAIAVPAKNVKMLETGRYEISRKPVLPVTAQGDSQVLLTFPNAGRLYGANLTVPANLGAGAVCKLQKRDAVTGVAVDITASSNAATAGIATSVGLLPIDFNAGDTIELLVSGAATTTAAQIAFDLGVQHS